MHRYPGRHEDSERPVEAGRGNRREAANRLAGPGVQDQVVGERGIAHVDLATVEHRAGAVSAGAAGGVVPDPGAGRWVEGVRLVAGRRDIDRAVGHDRRAVIPVVDRGGPADGSVGLVDGIERAAEPGASGVDGAVQRRGRPAELGLARQLGEPEPLSGGGVDRPDLAVPADHEEAARLVGRIIEGRAAAEVDRRPERGPAAQVETVERGAGRRDIGVDHEHPAARDQRIRQVFVGEPGGPAGDQRRIERRVDLGAVMAGADLEGNRLIVGRGGRRARAPGAGCERGAAKHDHSQEGRGSPASTCVQRDPEFPPPSPRYRRMGYPSKTLIL